MRMVDALEWDLTHMQCQTRMRRLVSAPRPEDIVSAVAKEAGEWARSGWVTWECGTRMIGCRRARTTITLEPNTFDALINGRSGYRAQYYLSCLEGAAFNLVLVAALLDALKTALTRDSDQAAKLHSFQGPWSKVWVHLDSIPFEDAPAGEFRPQRWYERCRDSHWLRAPLPARPAIDVIGTWISNDQQHKQDPCKANRDSCLNEGGFA